MITAKKLLERVKYEVDAIKEERKRRPPMVVNGKVYSDRIRFKESLAEYAASWFKNNNRTVKESRERSRENYSLLMKQYDEIAKQKAAHKIDVSIKYNDKCAYNYSFGYNGVR